MPKSLKEKIDQTRGDIPRSKYISRILEGHFTHKNQQNTRSQLAYNTADPLYPPDTTYSEVDVADSKDGVADG
jgi:hypothetical protein